MKTYKLYIVLTRTSSIVSTMIHSITKAKYTHAALSFDKSLHPMYGFSRKYCHNPFYGVFKKECMDEGFLSLHTYLPGAIIEISVTEAQYNKAREIVNKFERDSHLYKYNYIGLFSNMFGKSMSYEHYFFCSEFVYYVLSESGILNFGCARSLVRPQDFFDNCFIDDSCKMIYEGDLKKRQPILIGECHVN